MDDSRGNSFNTGGPSLGDDRQPPSKVPSEKRLSRFSTLLPKQPGGIEAPHGGGSTATANRPERQPQVTHIHVPQDFHASHPFTHANGPLAGLSSGWSQKAAPRTTPG